MFVFITSTSICYAEPTTWNFAQGTPNYDVDNTGNAFGNTLSIDSDNDGTPELTIQAWSDTGPGWAQGNDSEVFQGFASTNSGGLLNYNLDTPTGKNPLTGESHVIDNRDGDVDMMFFTFSESVALTGIDIGWANGDTDVSIVAFNTLPTLEGNTWSEIVDQSFFSASFSNLGLLPYTLANVDAVSGAIIEAQYWLIGAYNSIFGDSGANDHNSDSFKIATITTKAKDKPSPKPPTEVSEPSTIAMFASFGLFLMWRRRKSV